MQSMLDIHNHRTHGRRCFRVPDPIDVTRECAVSNQGQGGVEGECTWARRDRPTRELLVEYAFSACETTAGRVGTVTRVPYAGGAIFCKHRLRPGAYGRERRKRDDHAHNTLTSRVRTCSRVREAQLTGRHSGHRPTRAHHHDHLERGPPATTGLIKATAGSAHGPRTARARPCTSHILNHAKRAPRPKYMMGRWYRFRADHAAWQNYRAGASTLHLSHTHSLSGTLTQICESLKRYSDSRR